MAKHRKFSPIFASPVQPVFQNILLKTVFSLLP